MLLSHWQFSCGYPQYGSVIKKIERLAHTELIDVIHLEKKYVNHHVAEFDFLIAHEADNWCDLLQETLLVAKRVSVAWEITLVANDDVGAIQKFKNQYPPINHIEWIRWHINLKQNYARLSKREI